MRILLLTEREIKPLISMNEVIEAVEAAFREKALGHAQMPPKVYLIYEQYGGDLRVMPSCLERLGVSAVKVVNSHPQNPRRFNLPTVMAVIILVDPATGAPLSIMNGTWITAMRTGAAGGVAAKYLANEKPERVGLVGAGMQARTQLMALLSIYDRIDEVRVWSRSEERRKSYASEMTALYGDRAEIIPVETVRDAVVDADIIVTTTPSRKPLVSDEWISEGIHITCIGADAPGKEELDPAILKRARIFVDDWEQCLHSGEINVPIAEGIITRDDISGELGEVVAGLRPGRRSPDEITVFTSTGLAVQDAVTAKLVYEKALAKGLGRWIDME